MTYAQAAHFAQTWGLVLLAVCFAAALVFALWPGNRAKFDRAARAPLEDGDENDQQR